MPLIKISKKASKKKRKAVASKNIAREIRAGKNPSQAIAIGLSSAGLSRKTTNAKTSMKSTKKKKTKKAKK